MKVKSTFSLALIAVLVIGVQCKRKPGPKKDPPPDTSQANLVTHNVDTQHPVLGLGANTNTYGSTQTQLPHFTYAEPSPALTLNPPGQNVDPTKTYRQYSKDALKDAVRTVIEDGMDANAAGTLFGVPPTTVRDHVKRKKNQTNIQIYRNYSKEAFQEALKQVREDNMSSYRAGNLYGVPSRTLSYYVKHNVSTKGSSSSAQAPLEHRVSSAGPNISAEPPQQMTLPLMEPQGSGRVRKRKQSHRAQSNTNFPSWNSEEGPELTLGNRALGNQDNYGEDLELTLGNKNYKKKP